MSNRLHIFWWFFVPVLFMCIQIGLELTLSQDVLTALLSEQGPHEALQFLIVSAGFLIAGRTLFLVDRRSDVWLFAWVFLATVCCLYVAGEEISWGQHVWEWATPEFWDTINDQAETNIHNTSSWFDQKPRLLLRVGILVGGILMPVILRFQPSLLPEKFAVIYPPAALSLTAVMAWAIYLTDKVTHSAFFERISELEELYMFYFVLLYLVILKRRVVQR